MVAFLEKHFEFTTSLSIDECVTRLEAKSKRGSGWLASQRDTLVRVSDNGDGKKFSLDRDAGRNLWAEVHGQLRKIDDHTVHVGGFGRTTLFNFLFTIFYLLTACVIAYAFRAVPPLAIFWFLAGIMALVFLFLTIRNRNNLITIVYQTLDTRNDH